MLGAPAVSRPNWQWKKASAAGVPADAQVSVQMPPGPRFPKRPIEYGPSRRSGQAQSTRVNASNERIWTERLSCAVIRAAVRAKRPTFAEHNRACCGDPSEPPTGQLSAMLRRRWGARGFSAAPGDVKSKVETVIQPLPRKLRFVNECGHDRAPRGAPASRFPPERRTSPAFRLAKP